MAQRKIWIIMTLSFLMSYSSIIRAATLGEAAPDFELKAFDGTPIKLSDFKGKVVVLEWFSPECPFVKKHYSREHMQKLQDEYTKKGVVWLTIASANRSNSAYMDEERATKVIRDWKIKSSHVLDDSQGVVGKLYQAKTTPHMFVIGSDGVLRYQGAIDSNSAIDADPDGSENYVKVALDALLAGNEVVKAETKPYGCSVKY